ncbi:MAG: NAD(P)-dependent oxidoreductase [Methylocystis sp.]|nr:NAD(P)-dependent oxidoreductase [Methylocystis sp.]MCA3584957.1 NAD(P)-dependent oxidoreductase [Methylocystis sp.]MCA3589841.1 NAD(P)-dependent oxidoreductase [Methylocystis sp.]MCA3593496.1 NAD(P)-dependent oxidoreductase [Methylocystis sp.]
MAAKDRIGFIGVGFMGHGMAKNLLEKGFPLTIMGNRNRAPVDALIALGATEVKTPAEVARASDILFLCVTDSSVVEKLIRGPEGIKAGASKGLVVVDCSTANPVSTQELAEELKPLGITFCDAPLNGTPAQAEVGQLGAMIGADDATLARIRPAVEAWAARIAHVGGVGAGHQMKLLNNFLAMGYGAIYAEALALARKSGITPKTFDSVLRGSRMDCGFYQTFFRYVLEGDRNAHLFTLNNALKDLRYLEAMADGAKLSNPVGNAVKNSYAIAVAQGRGEEYVPMVSDAIAELNGLG